LSQSDNDAGLGVFQGRDYHTDAKLNEYLIVSKTMALLKKLVIFMLLCNIVAAAMAATVHHWVDDDGVTHFSDSAPASAIEGATTLIIDDGLSGAQGDSADYYSIVNQWQRMRAERDKNIETSSARARIRADHAAALNYDDQPRQETSEQQYYPAYGFPYRHRGRTNIGYYPESRSRPGVNRGRHHVQPNHGRLRSSNRSSQAHGHGGRQNSNSARGHGLSSNFDFR
jgi:hypothetical protein